jgi:hypothetical protein
MNDIKQSKFVCIDKSLFAHLRSIAPDHLSVNEYVDELLRNEEVSGGYNVYSAAIWNRYYGDRSHLQSIRVDFKLYKKLQSMQRYLKEQKSTAIDVTSILHFAIFFSIYGQEMKSKPTPWAGETRNDYSVPDPFWTNLLITADGYDVQRYRTPPYHVNEWEPE